MFLIFQFAVAQTRYITLGNGGLNATDGGFERYKGVFMKLSGKKGIESDDSLKYNLNLSVGIRVTAMMIGYAFLPFLPIPPSVSIGLKAWRSGIVFFEYPLLSIGVRKYFFGEGSPPAYLSVGLFPAPILSYKNGSWELGNIGFDVQWGWDFTNPYSGFMGSLSFWLTHSPKLTKEDLKTLLGISVRIGWNFKIQFKK